MRPQRFPRTNIITFVNIDYGKFSGKGKAIDATLTNEIAVITRYCYFIPPSRWPYQRNSKKQIIRNKSRLCSLMCETRLGSSLSNICLCLDRLVYFVVWCRKGNKRIRVVFGTCKASYKELQKRFVVFRYSGLISRMFSGRH